MKLAEELKLDFISLYMRCMQAFLSLLGNPVNPKLYLDQMESCITEAERGKQEYMLPIYCSYTAVSAIRHGEFERARKINNFCKQKFPFLGLESNKEYIVSAKVKSSSTSYPFKLMELDGKAAEAEGYLKKGIAEMWDTHYVLAVPELSDELARLLIKQNRKEEALQLLEDAMKPFSLVKANVPRLEVPKSLLAQLKRENK